MSATVPPSTGDNSKKDCLKQCLLDHAKGGKMYFKSKFITGNVGLSPKKTGALVIKFRDSATDLSIERWSYTSATTWCIKTT